MSAILISTAIFCMLGVAGMAVYVAFYGGHTYTEIAGILGLAVGTVKSRIRAGLSAMQTIDDLVATSGGLYAPPAKFRSAA